MFSSISPKQILSIFALHLTTSSPTCSSKIKTTSDSPSVDNSRNLLAQFRCDTESAMEWILSYSALSRIILSASSSACSSRFISSQIITLSSEYFLANSMKPSFFVMPLYTTPISSKNFLKSSILSSTIYPYSENSSFVYFDLYFSLNFAVSKTAAWTAVPNSIAREVFFSGGVGFNQE